LGGLKEVTGKGGRVQGVNFFFFQICTMFRFRKSGAKKYFFFLSVQAFFVIVLSILKSEQKKVKTFKYKYYLNVESR